MAGLNAKSPAGLRALNPFKDRDEGDAARDRREWKVAADCYRRHLEKFPRDFSIFVQLGHALKESHDLVGALSAYSEALGLNDGDADLQIQLGHLHKVMGHMNLAMEFYMRSARLGHPDAAREIDFLQLQKLDAISLDLTADNSHSPQLAEVQLRIAGAKQVLAERGTQLTAELTQLRQRSSSFESEQSAELQRSEDAKSWVASAEHALAEREAQLTAELTELRHSLLAFEAEFSAERQKHENTRHAVHVEIDLAGISYAGDEIEHDFLTHYAKIAPVDQETNSRRTDTRGLTYNYKIINKYSDVNVNIIRPKTIAFYLPQYHRVKENDEWWGEGFTEWTNVKKARPNFVGHHQPHIPAEMGYYDLEDFRVQQRQFELATEYGISAFCYYMYWFDGRRILEKPLDNIISNRSLEHKFCICWANENWTRTWDGNEKDILIGQVHTPESDRRFIIDALKYLSDDRYLRVRGKPMLLVYRVDLLPDCRATAAIWREEAMKAGLGDLHLCAVQFYGVDSPIPWGFDAAVEFPPHGWLAPENLVTPAPEIINPDFRGTIFDYEKAVDWALSKPIPNYIQYRACFPGWDNTARRQHTPHLFHGNTPALFQKWYQSLLEQAVTLYQPEDQIVFINAWNEWGEGAHLEPCERLGRSNLEAVHSALSFIRSEENIFGILNKILRHDGGLSQKDALVIIEYIRNKEMANRALSSHLRTIGVNPMEIT